MRNENTDNKTDKIARIARIVKDISGCQYCVDRCGIHGGENRRKRRAKDDRYKNHRRNA